MTNFGPSPEEVAFLTRAFNFFYDVHEEAKTPAFWQAEPYYRFNRVRDAFLVYSEILEYEPTGWFLEELKKSRPPMEAELSHDFCLFVRNLLIHFPFFKNWNEVVFTKELINWSKPGRTIDRFLTKFSGRESVKYRAWDPKTKEFIYVSICFPSSYAGGVEFSLKDFMPEREGVLFALSLMRAVLDSVVEK